MDFATPVSPICKEPAPALLPTSRLGVALRADFEALQNDFQQASELASDFQRQLAGKSNEFADLKHLFEKTTQNLARLQTDIVELREERHRLANDAMRATGLEYQLQAIMAERDQLKADVAEAQTIAVLAKADYSAQAELNARLTAELEVAKRPPSPQRGAVSSSESIRHPRAASLLSEIARSVDQLRDMIDRPGNDAQPIRLTPATRPALDRAAEAKEEFINISYSN